MQESNPNRWHSLLGAGALTYLVCVVFFPIVGFEFVDLDTPTQVVENPHIQGLTLEKVKHIFTSRCITSYYPIRTLSYAIDYQLWGLNAGGFKLTNGLIHLANVLLTFWLILRLFARLPADKTAPAWWQVAVAAFWAGVLAVHPVVVEPVAWVPGREELLMALGTLACLHFHITARRLDETGGKTGAMLACYAGAAVCCAAACLSNAVAAIIPTLIVAWDALTLPRPRLKKILLGSAALWAIAAAAIVIKAFSPDHHGFSGQDALASRVIEQLAAASSADRQEPGTLSAGRFMLILNVYWLNLKTLVWPTNLAMAHSAIQPTSLLAAGSLLGAAAVGLTGVVLWISRRRTMIVLGIVWFVLALGPTCQIMHHHTPRADRYLYLPLLGLAVAGSAALQPARNAFRKPAGIAALIAAGLSVLLVLDTISAHQVQTWQNSLTMWENCVRVEPDNVPARMYLAENLAIRGQVEEAAEHYRELIRLTPAALQAMQQLAPELAASDRQETRDYEMAIRLARHACDLTGWKDPQARRSLAIAYTGFAESQVKQGTTLEAAENFRNALKADPDHTPALRQLATILATAEDESLKSPDEAVRLAERGCLLSEPDDPQGPSVLAAVYASVGRYEMAVTTAEKALAIAQAAGNNELTKQLRGRLQEYQESVAKD